MDTKVLSASELTQMIDEIEIEEYPLYVDLFLNDSRKIVQGLGKKLASRYKKYIQEKEKLEHMKVYENNLYMSGYTMIAGVDEVGRGPLAGPVVASAVILPKDFSILGINDSKMLTEKKREQLYQAIQENALVIGIGIVDHNVIDEINILNASKLAMEKAIESLVQEPDYILIDAITLENLSIGQKGIIKGDQKSISIASASIIAKVTRDRMMCEYHERFPQYDFQGNKGYGTEKHYEGIKKHGLCPIHRKTFLKEFTK